MANRRTLFAVMKAATGSAISGLTGVIEGTDAVAGKVAALVSAFQDSSGDAAFPTLNGDGSIPVSFDSGDCLRANGSLAGTDTLSLITGAEITLVASKWYQIEFASISSPVDSCFILEAVEDEGVTDVITVLWEGIVGPGSPNACCSPKCLEFQAGTTGTLKLRMRAMNADTNEVGDLKTTFTARQNDAAA